jgi:hypothetical protein
MFIWRDSFICVIVHWIASSRENNPRRRGLGLFSVVAGHAGRNDIAGGMIPALRKRDDVVLREDVRNRFHSVHVMESEETSSHNGVEIKRFPARSAFATVLKGKVKVG